MGAPVVSLSETYEADSGRVYMTGLQALVRLPMTQMKRDRAAGLNTAAFVTGYRGSPVGGYDMQLTRAKKWLDPLGVTFQPGVNEDLAATAVWGTQQVGLSPGARKDGVLGIWYGKGPGVDRTGDVFKHGNAAGSSRHGGVLCIAGDDHTCKSSTVPHQSDHAFMSALIPCLYPSSIHEFLEVGLLGVAMSRFSGCWVGLKVISETVETTSVVDLAQEARVFRAPEGFETPPDGLNLRWPDPPLVQDERLQERKGYAALAFARANRVDEVTFDSPTARFGIVGSGKAYEDVLQALDELGLDQAACAALGLRLYKVRMPWPLEPEGVRGFAEGLEEVLVVEERREMIENQIKQALYNWVGDARPRVVGKFDEADKPFLPHSTGLTVGAVARAIARRLLRLELPDDVRRLIESRLERLEALEARKERHAPPTIRLPHFCAGCPHNTSTRVPEGSRALAGIGCHYMVQWMDRSTETYTQMGGEGVPWTAISRYTDEPHVFVNIGDGTYFHSGHLAIRQSVASGANMTYKVLYNDAVAMTGGQSVDGDMTPERITHLLAAEGVTPIYLLSDQPDLYKMDAVAPGVIVKHRDEMDAVMRTLRDAPGCSAIVYVQTCAAELRRRRKRGLVEDPDVRAVINPAVCEGCGDCSVQSNCIAIDPLETAFGRKRTINQSACNKDLSCVKGFCPSFVTVSGGKPKKSAGLSAPDVDALPAPAQPALARVWNIAVTGVGGTGVLTIGALMAMAARIEGKSPMVMDMAGLAQKGGAVLSYIRIGAEGAPVTSPRIAAGAADVLLAADGVVAASKDGVTLCDPERTTAVLNAKLTPTSDFVRDRDVDFRAEAVARTVLDATKTEDHVHDFASLARATGGDEIFANVMLLGYACQAGLVPLSVAAVEQAIEVNGVAVAANQAAFRWGRMLAHDPSLVEAAIAKPTATTVSADMTVEEIVAHQVAHLTAYQDDALAERYRALVDRVSTAAASLSDAAQADALRRAVAVNYAKLLSYKDEYEVARLFSTPEFEAYLREQLDGDLKLTFHLAPPMLPGRDANGRPKKRRFGAWMLPIFRRLARLKHLRGTRWDPFGRTAERRAERALIVQFEADVELALEKLSDATVDVAIALLSVPDVIRGFGPVKAEAMETARRTRADAIERFHSAGDGGAGEASSSAIAPKTEAAPVA